MGSMERMTQISADDTRALYIDGLAAFLKAVMPLLLISGMVSVVFTFAQTRFLFSAATMEFKLSRLNPLEGFKKMLSIRGLTELVKSVIKITILGYIIYKTLLKRIARFPRMMDMPIRQSAAFLGETIMSIAVTAGAVFLVVAALDYFYQWWDYEKQLRMSKQELKEEYKQMEGDPQIKGKIRELQRHQAMSRMMQKVPKADVVIRNPTHYAVAIAYEAGKNKAPVVLAKGADFLAKRIIETAQIHEITIMENKPLARGLFETVDVDSEIPEQFYKPVAEVLAFVYNLKKKEWR
jgi:flagellar biosynthetic protein FlhB